MVYFDNAATSPMIESALERFRVLSTEVPGNPSSSHAMGRKANEAFEEARAVLSTLFQVPESHVLFTSGGTEANNLAIWGALGGLVQAVEWMRSESAGRLMTSSIEHPSVRQPLEALQTMGASISTVPIDSVGLMNLTHFENELTKSGRVRILSVHHVQSEIGVAQDLPKLSRLLHTHHPDALFHVDACQSFLKIPLSLRAAGVDMLSLSAHKLGGPKGIGALILGDRFRQRNPKLGAFLMGANQQNGIRPGTIPVPLIGAFAEAVKCGLGNFESNNARVRELWEHLCKGLPAGCIVHGPDSLGTSTPLRSPHILAFSIPGIPAAVAVEALSSKDFCISAGSACSATSRKPNETLLQMGVDSASASSMLRVSFGPQNTSSEINGFLNALNEVIHELR